MVPHQKEHPFMKILEDPMSFSCQEACALTIGFFDGVHRGHKKLLQRMRALKEKGQKNALVTFKEHPSAFFFPEKKFSYLTDLSTRIALLEKEEIDLLFLFSFDEDLSKLSYQEFIHQIRKKFPFTHLVLGENAFFGHNRLGRAENIAKLASKLSFSVEYLPLEKEKKTITSTQIRSLIRQGKLLEAEKLLGRPFGYFVEKSTSFYLHPLFMTEFFLKDLVLPPQGTYSVFVKKNLSSALLQITNSRLLLITEKKPEKPFSFYFQEDKQPGITK